MKTPILTIAPATTMCTASVTGVATRPNTTLEHMCQLKGGADMQRNQGGFSF